MNHLSEGDLYVYQTVEMPQANDLEKVFRVVGLLADGAETAEEIAEGLAIVEREGAYYATAACALRLTRKRESAEGVTYEITGYGRDYLEIAPGVRAEFMTGRVLDCPHVKQLALDMGVALPLRPPIDGAFLDEARIADAMRGDAGLGASTRERRASCIVAWMKQVNRLVGAGT